MKVIVVSVIGLDCPGIVYTVSSNLAVLGCSIQEANQTILKNQFVAIFIVTCPASFTNDAIQSALAKATQGQHMQLVVSISDFVEGALAIDEVEPFVVTVQGNDRRDIVASIAKVFAEHRVNIENFKAQCLPDQEDIALLVFEVALPKHINFSVLRQTLMDKAAQLGLVLSMQHRDIFEAIHRVSPI